MAPETPVKARPRSVGHCAMAALPCARPLDPMSHAEKPQRTPVRAREDKDDAAGTALTGRFAVLTSWSGLPGGAGRSPRDPEPNSREQEYMRMLKTLLGN